MNLLPIDSIDALKKSVEIDRNLATNTQELIDDIEDLLIMSYVYGSNSAAESLGVDAKPSLSAMQSALDKEYDGLTYKDRISKYAEELKNIGHSSDFTEETASAMGQYDGVGAEPIIYDIQRVIDTESTRMYNDGVYNTALAYGDGNATKRWVTMGDDRVRDTHEYLDGLTVAINDDFYTFDGDHAPYPGGFSSVSNNANCRCIIEIQK